MRSSYKKLGEYKKEYGYAFSDYAKTMGIEIWLLIICLE